MPIRGAASSMPKSHRSIQRGAAHPRKIYGKNQPDYSSANRDETQYENPFSFSIERENTKNLAFGFGPHVCLGQHLSRMEMRIFWEELLPRLESVELTGTPLRSESNFVNGPKSVPIRFKMK
jgi:cytochrome P450